MRILIANDDGYLAPGIAALIQACAGLGEIDVVAPEQNASGTSNSLTLNRPLSVYPARHGHGEALNSFRYVTGTPSDCVHVALTGLLPQRPDLVVSGINNGANMGDDTLYSGTVAAAMEGFLFGVPAIAFSQVEKGWAHLDAAARVARSVIEHALREPPAGAAWLLNVNIPNRADAAERCGEDRQGRAVAKAPDQPLHRGRHHLAVEAEQRAVGGEEQHGAVERAAGALDYADDDIHAMLARD